MHTEIIDSSQKNNKGSLFATIRIITNTIGIVTPIISGFIVAQYGFYSTFLIGVIISVLAVIPLFKLQEKEQSKVDWNAKKVVREFIAQKNRKFILALFAMGIENSVAVIV